MSESHAPSIAQAYARALRRASGFSNARTYVRTYRELLTYVVTSRWVTRAGGAAKNV